MGHSHLGTPSNEPSGLLPSLYSWHAHNLWVPQADTICPPVLNCSGPRTGCSGGYSGRPGPPPHGPLTWGLPTVWQVSGSDEEPKGWSSGAQSLCSQPGPGSGSSLRVPTGQEGPGWETLLRPSSWPRYHCTQEAGTSVHWAEPSEMNTDLRDVPRQPHPPSSLPGLGFVLFPRKG